MTNHSLLIVRKAFTYPHLWRTGMELVRRGDCVIVKHKRHWFSELMIIESAH